MEIYPGTGVKITVGEMTSIKMVSHQPTVLARNLFRRFFSTEELSTHSLLGKTCNANRDSASLPAIDNIRRDAIMSKC